jgi:hypothetical protein
MGSGSARTPRFADEAATADAPDEAASAAHRKRADELQEKRRAIESFLRGLQAAGLDMGPAYAALQQALGNVSAQQQAHRSEKDATLPTKVLHERACRDRDQWVQKLARSKTELEAVQAQLEALLTKQEELQARTRDQSAKVALASQRVLELGHKLALETVADPAAAAARPSASPFTAATPGAAGAFSLSGGSPFKRQRPEADAVDADEPMLGGSAVPYPPSDAGLSASPTASAAAAASMAAARNAAPGAVPAGFVP